MSRQEYIANLKAKIAAIEKSNPAFEIAVRTTIADQSRRIFVEGKNSSNGNIGQYDTKRPLYINPDKKGRSTGNKAKGIQGLKKAGKTGETKFKNGKPHKTAYLNNYKDFRNRVGARIDKVNLVLTGDLQSDFNNSPSESKVEPKKRNANSLYVSVTREINSKKIAGITEKYGEVFKLTKQERSGFKDILGKELRARL